MFSYSGNIVDKAMLSDDEIEKKEKNKMLGAPIDLTHFWRIGEVSRWQKSL
jgi:hypothetical protein